MDETCRYEILEKIKELERRIETLENRNLPYGGKIPPKAANASMRNPYSQTNLGRPIGDVLSGIKKPKNKN